MSIRHVASLIALVALMPAPVAAAPAHTNPKLAPEVRARLLLKQMTRAEKLGQLRAATVCAAYGRNSDSSLTRGWRGQLRRSSRMAVLALASSAREDLPKAIYVLREAISASKA